VLNPASYVTIIGGSLVDFMEEYPTFSGYYIVDGDQETGAPQMLNGSWFILDNGIAKTPVDQFGSASGGAAIGTIYERLDADSDGDDVNNDWAPVLSPTPGGQNENPIQNEEILPVELTSFAATAMTSQDEDMFVRLEWTVESENNLLGYNVYRSEMEDINSTYLINGGMIEATNQSSNHSYSYEDIEVIIGGTFYYWLESVSIDGINQFFGPVAVTVDPDQEEPETPEVLKVTSLNSIYPNPFNPTTSVKFSLKEESKVTVRVFNVRGELVSELANGVFPSSTNHTVVWNGTDVNGKNCGSGIYFFKMEAKGYTSVKKAVLVK
ncbi:MAG: T9SS type A sorting domain-containing protein, partial [Candidatus Cloacimonetes bacterium]|nr:T9SS type A sorting domain-containing protein [Candidatus Cloacimonadota bacterium]